MKLTDSHAHLIDERFQQDYEQVLERARTAGVTTIINVGYDLASSAAACDLAEKAEGLYAAVGIHPHEASSYTAETARMLRKLAAHPKVVALGEMGLDYYYNHSPRHVQQEVFRKQLGLARELSLPVIIHDRDAHDDLYRILCEENAQEVGGVLHCFSGDTAFAAKCLQLGFYLSLAGPVTFQNAGELLEVAKMVPSERLLIETDAPYLAPVPYRGRRNEPAYVRLVAEKIAALRGMETAEVAEMTSRNARAVFSLD
ncbi:MAG: TatD family hydrolase [Firmicutes bacterium]|jgi:TatD DNase family protein|nr:TatD family hydrolase [Bacillota bacterium]